MEIALDAIGYSKALQKAGMPREQADIIARTEEAREERIIESRDLATKKDIAILKKDLKKDLADLRAELKQDIASTVAASERHLTNLLLGVAAVIIAAIGVAVAILR